MRAPAAPRAGGVQKTFFWCIIFGAFPLVRKNLPRSKKNLREFSKKLPRFSENLRHFWKYLRRFTLQFSFVILWSMR